MVGKYDSWFLQHSCTGTDSVSADAASFLLAAARVHMTNTFHNI